MRQYFIHDKTETNKCLNRDIFQIYPQNELISNLISATGIKKVGTGQQRSEKARQFEKIEFGEHLETN